jgi:hypothetical protein
MLKIRCKNCNTELISHPAQTKCCGCDNLTSICGEKITANDLSLVEIVSNENNKQTKKSVLSRQDLEFQELRRNRKIRKLNFDIR